MNNNAVAFCVTGPHLQLTAVAITSILQHYHHESPLKILVVCGNVQQPDIEYIRTLPEKHNKPMVTIDFWGKPAAWINDIKPYYMKDQDSIAPSVLFWRMFLPAYYPTYEKILYLDNDVIVNTDVTNLFEALDDNHTLAAVSDFLFAASKNYDPAVQSSEDALRAHGLKNLRFYFNDGVMVMNVARYNQRFSVEKIVSLINDASWNLPDQTLMNIMFQGDTKLLSYRYNYQHSLEYFDEPYNWDPKLIRPILDAYQHIAIRHFASDGPLSTPYAHVSIHDAWEATFLASIKSSENGLNDRG